MKSMDSSAYHSFVEDVDRIIEEGLMWVIWNA